MAGEYISVMFVDCHNI